MIAEHYGWRASCFAWAALHLALALPINIACIPAVRAGRDTLGSAAASGDTGEPFRWTPESRRAFVLLAFFAALTAFVPPHAAHLPGLVAVALARLRRSAVRPGLHSGVTSCRFLASRRFSFHPLRAPSCHRVPSGAESAPHPRRAPAVASAFAFFIGGNGMITIAKARLLRDLRAPST